MYHGLLVPSESKQFECQAACIKGQSWIFFEFTIMLEALSHEFKLHVA